MKIVHAYTRRCNSGSWEFYGSFTEAEWQAELAGHLAFLRSMGPLYVLTNPSGKRAQLELPQCGPDFAGQGRRATETPLMGRVPQQPCNIGLFSDDAKQAVVSLLDGKGFKRSRPDS